ncbi:uncharacterized protein SCHCODRAFT_01259931 [Schizophyllum commune H4-8]|uniref:Expressed protein n=1 Tax=Schizophyllum commune (strain H4-8 / FGSC 9210) TaxID=578458 RepID=D8QKZ9_SCHCM|nr:uncharacterized protein SCHCODRAFT_01259931 [Schizophyllum commune H4-8]KAI5885364.1 hypothetical protein SCHCODRAFT_01259931 [Schizophyllum commune H4-8]
MASPYWRVWVRESAGSHRWASGRSPFAHTCSPGAPSRQMLRPPPEKVVAQCSRDAPQTLLATPQRLGACLA